MTPETEEQDLITDDEGTSWALADARRNDSEPELTEEYVNSIHDKFSEEFSRALQQKTRDLLHNMLLLSGDPKNYREYYQLVGSTAESLIIYLLARGYLGLEEKATADDDTVAKRVAKRVERDADRELTGGGGLAEALAKALSGGGGKEPAAGYL